MKEVKSLLALLLVFSIAPTFVYSMAEEPSYFQIIEWSGVIIALIPSLYFFYLANEFKGILKRTMIFLALGFFIMFLSFAVDIFTIGSAHKELTVPYHHILMIISMLLFIFVGRDLHRTVHKIKEKKSKK